MSLEFADSKKENVNLHVILSYTSHVSGVFFAKSEKESYRLEPIDNLPLPVERLARCWFAL